MEVQSTPVWPPFPNRRWCGRQRRSRVSITGVPPQEGRLWELSILLGTTWDQNDRKRLETFLFDPTRRKELGGGRVIPVSQVDWGEGRGGYSVTPCDPDSGPIHWRNVKGRGKTPTHNRENVGRLCRGDLRDGWKWDGFRESYVDCRNPLVHQTEEVKCLPLWLRDSTLQEVGGSLFVVSVQSLTP